MSKIRKRLKAAYENVVFYSNSTWVNISHMYQRANQVVYEFRKRKFEMLTIVKRDRNYTLGNGK